MYTAYIDQAAFAIINAYQGDKDKIAAFYTAAAHLRGSCPLVDAILDRIDSWIVEQTYRGVSHPLLAEVLQWPDTL